MRTPAVRLAQVLLLTFAAQSLQEKRQNSLRILAPVHNATYQTGSVSLVVDITPLPGVNLSSLVVCVDVSWDKGTKSYCRNSHENSWLMQGLEDGNYLVVASLRDSDSITSQPLSQAKANFNVVVPAAEMLPRVFISFPTGNGRVFSGAAVEVSFYTTHFGDMDGVVCLTAYFLSALTPETHLEEPTLVRSECLSPEEHSWPLGTRSPQLPPGRYRVTARLHRLDGNPVEGAPFSAMNTTFLVAPAPGKSFVPPMATKVTADGEFEVAVEDRIIGSRDMMHVVVMSARVEDRYEEALVMLKSMLFQWRPVADARRRPTGLVLHLIVDDNGGAFFRSRLSSLTAGLPGGLLSVRYHRYEDVCVAPLEQFLSEMQLPMSSHYSGAAGYCRLFMPRYFNALGLEAFMAIESDQLFFADVTGLWMRLLEMDDRTQSTAFIAAPEMYQPWQHGRSRKSQRNPLGAMQIDSLDAGYHGNGLIGGIMLFNLTTMMGKAKWESRWKSEFKQYISSVENDARDPHSEHQKKWVPKLNDQDIFNAILTRQPQWLAFLSCEWNLQQHAFMNTNRLCAADGVAVTGGDNSGLNCDASLAEGMFVCPKSPAVVHFMSQSYLGGDPSYYGSFWSAISMLPMRLIREPLATISRERRATVETAG